MNEKLTYFPPFSFGRVLLIHGQAAADAKYYGNTEVYNILKTRGAKAPVSYSSLYTNTYVYIFTYFEVRHLLINL